MDHLVHGFIPSDEISDFADGFTLELLFQALSPRRQSSVHLIQIVPDLLYTLAYRALLGLRVQKYWAGSSQTSPANNSAPRQLRILDSGPSRLLFVQFGQCRFQVSTAPIQSGFAVVQLVEPLFIVLEVLALDFLVNPLLQDEKLQGYSN